ncbi:hypothetical protein RR46_05109 [Papilio xuthus]|uniref:Uncharacterized protein n=1 Tax=Papilio xuthus TaxID=66420 RepID=A0A194QA77_PAPXU|nr:hypothetical protein RR46_05109 [Papilio xuthus]
MTRRENVKRFFQIKYYKNNKMLNFLFAMPTDGDKKDPPTPPKSPNAMAYFGKAVADWTTGMEKLVPGNW